MPLRAETPGMGSPSALLHAMWRATRTSWSASFAAPIGLLGRCCFYMLLMTIITALWSKVAQEQVAGGLAHLLPAGGLGFYVGVTEIAVIGTPASQLRLEDDIRSGLIESRLLRPKSHLLLRIAEAVGSAAARVIVLSTCGTTLLVFSSFSLPPLVWWPGLLLLIVLAVFIGILIQIAIGLTVFWFGRSLPVHIVVQKLAFLLGGLMAPVTLYPDVMARFAMATPFAAQMYWPATMATAPSATTFAAALCAQSIWIALLALLVSWIWSRGVARTLREGC